mmetsp:Transcript_6219/g.13045  ORF Transcript_6219/g.13045 Transcript_6219/m.13045 type:complete len:668 (-) Transcript_6219:150-2153(-)
MLWDDDDLVDDLALKVDGGELHEVARRLHPRVPVLDLDRLEEGRSLALYVGAEARPCVAHHHVNGRHVRPRLRLWLQTPGLVHGARALVRVVVPSPGHVHPFLEEQGLQRRAQVPRHALVARVHARVVEGRVNVHGPVHAHDHKGGDPPVDAREVVLDEGVLVAALLKGVLRAHLQKVNGAEVKGVPRLVPSRPAARWPFRRHFRGRRGLSSSFFSSSFCFLPWHRSAHHVWDPTLALGVGAAVPVAAVRKVALVVPDGGHVWHRGRQRLHHVEERVPDRPEPARIADVSVVEEEPPVTVGHPLPVLVDHHPRHDERRLRAHLLIHVAPPVVWELPHIRDGEERHHAVVILRCRGRSAEVKGPAKGRPPLPAAAAAMAAGAGAGAGGGVAPDVVLVALAGHEVTGAGDVSGVDEAWVDPALLVGGRAAEVRLPVGRRLARERHAVAAIKRPRRRAKRLVAVRVVDDDDGLVVRGARKGGPLDDEVLPLAADGGVHAHGLVVVAEANAFAEREHLRLALAPRDVGEVLRVAAHQQHARVQVPARPVLRRQLPVLHRHHLHHEGVTTRQRAFLGEGQSVLRGWPAGEERQVVAVVVPHDWPAGEALPLLLPVNADPLAVVVQLRRVQVEGDVVVAVPAAAVVVDGAEPLGPPLEAVELIVRRCRGWPVG